MKSKARMTKPRRWLLMGLVLAPVVVAIGLGASDIADERKTSSEQPSVNEQSDAPLAGSQAEASAEPSDDTTSPETGDTAHTHAPGDTTHTHTPSDVQEGDPSSEAENGPPPAVLLHVSFASECVRAGGSQTITIAGAREDAVAYHATYADGKTFKDQGWYGGNNGGYADDSGVWEDTWVVGPGAPPGEVAVDVVSTRSGSRRASFRVADTQGRCA